MIIIERPQPKLAKLAYYHHMMMMMMMMMMNKVRSSGHEFGLWALSSGVRYVFTWIAYVYFT
jgi:hypothetical protein